MEAKGMAKDDIISSLPSTIVEIILCHVPIRDAVRTSILSRNWRYNWATIPKLVFNVCDMFTKSNEEHLLDQAGNKEKRLIREFKVFYAIHQVLFLHQGPILEFTLNMFAENTYVEIDQIILHLSKKNTVKKLTLRWLDSYKLPLSLFSLHQLTDLFLDGGEFDFSPTFSGFVNLTSLFLIDVKMSRETLVHLLSSCPLLERLSLDYGHPEDKEDGFTFALNELVKCLPVIQHLCFSSWNIECFGTGELPTTLVRLKSLCMSEMMFDCKFLFLSLFLLIRSSPNLEKIKLKQQIVDASYLMDPEINSLDGYSDIWLEHLNELEIQNFTFLEVEMEFVKLILAKSPVLKKVRILLASWVQDDKELKMLRILLCFSRASPVAEIIVKRQEYKW